MVKDKRPSLQFYPGDWRKDPGIACLSLEARGLWFEMLLLMFECSQRGYLKHGSGHPITEDQLARMVGAPIQIVKKCIAEMESAGTFSRDAANVIFNRRMVRDERIRLIRKEVGRLGGNPNLVGSLVNQKGNQTPTPSTSSSTSTSVPLNPQNDSADLEDCFERIWLRHPKRKYKGHAEHAWVQALGHLAEADQPPLARRIEAAHLALCGSDDWSKNGGMYAPQLHVWLNGKGWLDGVPEPPKPIYEKPPSGLIR